VTYLLEPPATGRFESSLLVELLRNFPSLRLSSCYSRRRINPFQSLRRQGKGKPGKLTLKRVCDSAWTTDDLATLITNMSWSWRALAIRCIRDLSDIKKTRPTVPHVRNLLGRAAGYILIVIWCLWYSLRGAFSESLQWERYNSEDTSRTRL
jgi:hypothetical protein